MPTLELNGPELLHSEIIEEDITGFSIIRLRVRYQGPVLENVDRIIIHFEDFTYHIGNIIWKMTELTPNCILGSFLDIEGMIEMIETVTKNIPESTDPIKSKKPPNLPKDVVSMYHNRRKLRKRSKDE